VRAARRHRPRVSRRAARLAAQGGHPRAAARTGKKKLHIKSEESN